MASGIFDIAAKIGRHRTRRDLTDIIGGSTSQISGILGQHLGDILKDRLQKSAAVGAAGQAASRLASQMLLDHPKYLMDPEVMKVAGVLLGFNSPSQLDPVIVADVLKVGVTRNVCPCYEGGGINLLKPDPKFKRNNNKALYKFLLLHIHEVYSYM